MSSSSCEEEIKRTIRRLLDEIADAKGRSSRIAIAERLFAFLAENKAFVCKYENFRKTVCEKIRDLRDNHDWDGAIKYEQLFAEGFVTLHVVALDVYDESYGVLTLNTISGEELRLELNGIERTKEVRNRVEKLMCLSPGIDVRFLAPDSSGVMSWKCLDHWLESQWSSDVKASASEPLDVNHDNDQVVPDVASDGYGPPIGVEKACCSIAFNRGFNRFQKIM